MRKNLSYVSSLSSCRLLHSSHRAKGFKKKNRLQRCKSRNFTEETMKIWCFSGPKGGLRPPVGAPLRGVTAAASSEAAADSALEAPSRLGRRHGQSAATVFGMPGRRNVALERVPPPQPPRPAPWSTSLDLLPPAAAGRLPVRLRAVRRPVAGPVGTTSSRHDTPRAVLVRGGR